MAVMNGNKYDNPQSKLLSNIVRTSNIVMKRILRAMYSKEQSFDDVSTSSVFV